MASVPHFTFRQAQASDYLDVINLNQNVYEGFDYMPALFHRFLADPSRRVFVLEMDGQVVALVMYRLVDSGESLIGQSGRVATRLRGSGVWLQVRKEMAKFEEMQTSVQRVMYTALKWDIHRKRIRQGKLTASLLMKRRIMYAAIDHQLGLDGAISSASKSKPQQMSRSNALRALSNINNQWQLFPQGFIVVAQTWEPFRLQPSNFEIIVNESTAIFGTQDMTANEEFSYMSLSFGFACPVKNGLVYRIDYYGLDEEDAAEHFLLHMRIGQRHHTTERFISHFALPLTMNRDRVEESLRQIKGIDVLPDFGFTYLVERSKQITSNL